ncbi:MAG: threonine--tRNA ligase [Candidatus Diapherotrites archaeon]
MTSVTVKFPDGKKGKYNKGITPLEIAQSIGQRLVSDSLAAEVNGKIVDLNFKIETDCDFRIFTFKDQKGKEALWHSSSHIMADAVKQLYPEAKVAIGPSIEEGFYYDFDVSKPFQPEDFPKIEKKMNEIAEKKLKFERSEMKREDAISFFKKQKEDYKVELIQDLPDKKVTIYKHGDFVDLCAGPHLLDTSKLRAFKLLKTGGAYWRGSEKNKMLQRIYGIAFPDKKMLNEYEEFQKEVKKRNHLKLGRELDLFSLHDEAPGVVFIHGNGMTVWNEMQNYWNTEHEDDGYFFVNTPIVLNESLWRQSGHWDHYKENMYFTKIDEGDYAIKPMNCPGGILIYKNKRYSYRDLPIRMAEMGIVHRHEKSGVLNGLFRVRKFSLDDAHIFCTEEQMQDEIIGVLNLVKRIYKTFGFDNVEIELSTRPEKFMGEIKNWDFAEETLKKALAKTKTEYKISEGDGAFYGPKIDFHIRDSLKRNWQCGTIQLDFSMPEKFDLSYIGKDDKEHRPVMIHRAIFGSMERFFGILIEHYAGNFPAWLSPMQVKIIAISDKHVGFANEIADKLRAGRVRVEVDDKNDTVSYKVRDAELRKIPYTLTVGDNEVASKKVAVRKHDGTLKKDVSVDDFVKELCKEIKERK